MLVLKIPPWSIVKRGPKFLVIGKEDGKIYGHHPTRAHAEKQMAALYLNVHKDTEIMKYLRSDDITVCKANEDQRLVTGWASVITNDDGSALEDLQGDVIDEPTLETAVHEFMRYHRNLGDSHVRIDGIGRVVESMVVTKSVKGALGLKDSTPSGWLITGYVEDDSTWNRVKKGELKAFSIGGSALRELVKEAPAPADAHVPTANWASRVARKRKKLRYEKV